ncbi:3',5'-cyclic AMP phosphodiesterase CpdA [Streptosporangium becharense]|uniref:3',5'-cyclic AMP phosphodiesterase CpdA n=1 Tax=Streptosporangium becharense TaxID=1816182 RepID=A0A7W9IE24_9ACTN|nr:LamG-like jellyroll fold domain-containing protein [Streptosporangium becharense]MBB2912024.1 3',5'-cyclic AMP phosphodiesterase CpdA [Streptosporangium becharense]MBB5818571.1 3',5'-cyclic AMP phosphodiesterase CpdA [Streptosporangium becharense]
MEDPSRPDVGRRSLLWAALAAPAVAAASTTAVALDAAPASAAGASVRTGRFDEDDPRFAIGVLPDTQYLFDEDSSDPTPLRATFRYLTEQRKARNIAFMTHLGDVTEHGSEHEIELAGDTFRAIDGKVSYSVLAGNHDVRSSTDDQRGDSAYLRAFGPARFAAMPTFRGASPDGYNSYHVLRAAGREWLVLALDWRVSDKGLAWAQGVVDANPKLPIILTTHDLAWSDEAGTASLSDFGRRLWDRFIRRNDQIFLTLNGHYWPPGRTVLKNDAGHDVHVHIANYQDRYYGGAAMIRLYTFDLARKVIDVETFSPWLLDRDPEDRTPLEAENLELTGPADRFSLQIDFDERFAGFAPRVLPEPRPASAVMPRGTVAYWRFDASGLQSAGTDGGVVPAGAVARDLTGGGNDLTVELLHASAAEVLKWSAEHHEGQPAHASLRFDGGKNPDRGAVLRTGPAAPLNSMKFESGYTIEAFIKLPEPFEGDHAWMGILSWEGRSGDAGKTSGWSQDEPTCSLNLSPERFLQYVVYPTDRDADPTSWSHALPVGRWTHVAVVNDGRRTVVYVDGSKIARNPTQRSKGISTLGKPFAIGGTQFAQKYGQGYYGWIGDVRIVSRALRPREFLTPFDS